MPAAKRKDEYPQFMVPSVTQSASDTLTFGRVNVGISLFDYAGFILSRLEYYPGRGAFNLITANDDELVIALTGSNTIDDLAIEQAQVYDKITLTAAEAGTPSNVYVGGFQEQPIVHDFTNLPGGGLLVPAQDVYIAVDSSNLGAAATCSMRVYFQVVPLKAEDYIELAQRLRVLSSS